MTPTDKTDLLCALCGESGRIMAAPRGFLIFAHCAGPELGGGLCSTATYPTIERALEAWKQIGEPRFPKSPYLDSAT